MEENDLGRGFVDAAIAVDRELGTVLAILASWREAIWIRVRCYKSGKLFKDYAVLLGNSKDKLDR